MTLFLEICFWFCIGLVVYTYLGYGVVAWIMVKIRNILGKQFKQYNDPSFLPKVTLAIPAYNEMSCIEAKLQNTFSLDYPADKLEVLFVTEGSNDGTSEFILSNLSKYPSMKMIGGTTRRGKIEAMNMAVKTIDSPIVIFTDANTNLNNQVIRNIVRHFQDPVVGAVAGEKRIETQGSEAAAGAGEGLYWKYESFLKKLDTQLYSVVGAAGELFAVRTHLFGEVEKDTLLDDFMVSLRIAADGYRVIYEPDAYASERPSFSIQDEMKRKIRIASGGFQSIARLGFLWNIFKYGLLSFQYVSHRAMRWAVAPFCLPLIFLLNIALVIFKPTFILQFFMLGQIAFYIMAIVGYYLENKKIRVKLLFVPFYFSFMNYCAIKGYLRYRNGLISGIWEKVKRAE
ncbi:cellulose synthase/poly-beta-1,6-N-acetylglucosamine synthase-like glycosyltransferase [Arcicella aurantiaca]|uniref:Cellulose synthase/poly-beta-1,6-N-acetylglucosamine synthase-like glycosyltransferase n=1 Tax=Arcicella aurantiaca TaxID=591202 RepID=A0A316EB02_9BACT|nr:glycosyltransferase family 2 protein [Arcicella aurantiaca]PWK20100.1 cellulose synthase/poly-beta-1,6-N-acetylglucosamine synthase-like glycosyltransferase [Arcicella aurantiaca]